MDHMNGGDMQKNGMCGNCEHGGGCHCKCMHHKVVPGLIVLFGLLFLAGNMGWVSMGTVAWWPVLVIAAGCMKLMKGKCKCC